MMISRSRFRFRARSRTRFHSGAIVSAGLLALAACSESPVRPSSAGPELGRGTSSTAGVPVYPDIIEAVPSHLQIQNTQQREWLRFSTTHMNIGEGNLQIRGTEIVECDIDDGSGTIVHTQCTNANQEILDAAGNVVATNPAGVAMFHPEHNHWHQAAVASFAIKSGNPNTGPVLASSMKITFCFVDVKTFSVKGSQKKVYPRTYFECNGDLQGLAAHWADEYHQSTPLQELEVTGLPSGDYYLTHEVDPENHWVESPNGGETNNFTWLKFRLTRTSSNPKITILGNSPCVIEAQCGFGGNP